MTATQTQSATQSASHGKRPATPRLTLDRLSRLTPDELAALYDAAAAPASLGALDGEPRGRMLALRYSGRGPVAAAVRRLAAWERFPWGGKSFESHGKGKGSGINRVKLAGEHKLFPFETRVGPSVVDGKKAVVLDYDLEENPGFIRKVHDEVREVSPGLFLGPAMWKTEGGAPALVLWFALDCKG